MFKRLWVVASASLLATIAWGVSEAHYAREPGLEFDRRPEATLGLPNYFFTDAVTSSYSRASETLHRVVVDRDGDPLGEVEELLFDGDGRIFAMVIAVHELPGDASRKIAFPFRSFHEVAGSGHHRRLFADVDKAAVKRAPCYAPMAIGTRNENATPPERPSHSIAVALLTKSP